MKFMGQLVGVGQLGDLGEVFELYHLAGLSFLLLHCHCILPKWSFVDHGPRLCQFPRVPTTDLAGSCIYVSEYYGLIYQMVVYRWITLI